ncbi:5'/3'-nucleotidase SurE [Streptomyces europaeiscabiei]|uniref:5'/3'-nucleotidase SurE n=1 Tax=Streptomyces europaeiscabiei TaxID=146819 RepID=UPI0029A0F716|nr:5'/3'-nucleotidase SurE [Streptomyces europaeiscabiei]MDX2759257.1 5'/3'-nucleotidase SurE [Streptomyces europaeiscabiei]
MSNDVPLILITNDDGLMSPGLVAAAEAVADLGQLLLVAPKEQQTSMSHALPKGKTIGCIEEVAVQVKGRTVKGFAVDGSPAQAVSHAVLELAERKPDLCISGINYGENLGLGLSISGTVGAAFEADAYEIPAMAVSLEADLSVQHSSEYPVLNWDAAKIFTRRLARQILGEGLPDGVAVINLNVPHDASEDTAVVQTRQSRQQYFVFVRPEPRNRTTPFKFRVDIDVDLERLEPESDIQALIYDRFVSVTPLTWDMTADSGWRVAQNRD